MNFILLSDYYYPIVKSGSVIVGDLVNELSQQGHKLTIVTFSENQSKKCEMKTMSQEGIKGNEMTRVKGKGQRNVYKEQNG